ncbi:NRAMP (natural resistance-associated macrophage protein)-like metal ion transporter [Roseiarcus fermentans]|uniref:NRAMP (Natural resistance-associated macrophage protein)-like metal ion transporter n=1 Tax=Roseiarcus fermentans TaxID=1473586 RepID=A0A366FSB7_9HYPH|nr:divalent metal cation transporter [Roseiarcus fermentans]RBP17573.1 NRAMP (natural resistance-associated macrophage protein)-like metal ion transporter [Roseiarcus fermentans]
MTGAAPANRKTSSVLGKIAVWGPGLLVMLADTDAGNVVTGAQAGAAWGYRFLPLLLLLIPMLYMVQELTVRLGIFTGRGYGELIRIRFGAGWAWLSLLGLAAAVIGSLVTEFTGVAGIGELYGVSRALTLPLAVMTLLGIVGTGSYRRVERVAIFVGLFELAFFAVAWAAHPSLAALLADVVDLPIRDRAFLYMAAAVIGAVFNPWMIFYQQSAIAEKKLQRDDFKAARLDTAFGAVLTQCLTGAIVIAAAATLGKNGASIGLGSVGEISNALSPALGETIGRLVFSAGVLGASLVAAIVCSLALAWGAGEITGYKHSLEYHPFAAKWFYGVYALCVVGSAVVVGLARDLVWLNIAAQALNAFLLPLVIGLLVALAVKALPEAVRLNGVYLWILTAVCTVVVAVGVFGGIQGVFAP